MSVRIRLKRLGRRNRAYWRICATDKRTARDGRVIEELGSYDPHAKNEDKAQVNRERASHWLRLGAQPSETVEALLHHIGIDRKGNEVSPKPWRKKKTLPPPAAKRVEKEKADDAGAGAAADVKPADEASPAEAEAAPVEAEASAETEAPAQEAEQAPAQEAEQEEAKPAE